MTREQWTALAARCEAATGPDREIEDAIATATGLRVVYEGHPIGRCWYDRNGSAHPFERYTSSLDAITALIERELPNSLYTVRQLWDAEKKGAQGSVFAYSGGHPYRFAHALHDGLASTPALALCAAFCRAMAERTAS